MDIIDEPASMNPPPLINVWLCIAIIIPVMFILTIMLICITKGSLGLFWWTMR